MAGDKSGDRHRVHGDWQGGENLVLRDDRPLTGEWEIQKPPPFPAYPPPGASYPSTYPPSYPPSSAPPPPSGYALPPSGYAPPPSGYAPPPSGYAPPPLGFRPPPPPASLGVSSALGIRPPPPPPPANLRSPPSIPSPRSNTTPHSGIMTPPTSQDEEIRTKSTTSQHVKEDANSGPVSKSRWDRKNSDKEETRKNEKSSDPMGGMKIKMGLGKRPGVGSISMKLKPQADSSKKPKLEATAQGKPSKPGKPASSLVAQAFGSDSDDEDEEMPPEAKLRMRNMGRDTPTSSGPNSFYKSAKGFTDPRGSWRNELLEDV